MNSELEALGPGGGGGGGGGAGGGGETTVGVGANNLFDVYPDKIGIVSPDTGTGQFGNLSPFGITGGYYYARVSRRF